jgi:hypothetical protein
MGINIQIDSNLLLVILGIVGVTLTLIQINLFSRYEKRIQKIKNALIGLMWVAKEEIVDWDKSNKKVNESNDIIPQGKIFNEFMGIFTQSNLLKYGGYLEKLIDCQMDLEREIDRLTIFLIILIIPVILLAFPDVPSGISFIIFYIDGMLIVMDTVSIIRDIKFINGLYTEYVLKREMFGGYEE